MKLKTRILALITSAALLLSPAATFAEGAGDMAPAVEYYAGELTPAVISDSYYMGQQINVSVGFAMQPGTMESETMQALSSLVEKCALNMSFYDDFGTARVRANLTLDGVKLFSADAMIYEDGSVQAMTNLTGKYVLALPAGAFVDGQLDMSIFESQDYNYYEMTQEEFAALPVDDRLKITMEDMGGLLLQHLLGWVSYVQMNTNRLYTFDDTYLDATQTRDAVAQRMVGKVSASEFCELLWNVGCTVTDEEKDFQQAVADKLAQMGVTRIKMRNVADTLFAQERIDPAVDMVETSYRVSQGDPNALCEQDDVAYLLKKALKSIDYIWTNSTEEYLDLIVSYDDYGKTVGIDARLPVFSTVVPYEGDFIYSLKTDDDWQETHTAHGELQVLGEQRVIGDITVVSGQDVDGVNASSLRGALNLVDTASGLGTGFGIDSALIRSLDSAGLGEEIAGNLDITLNHQGQALPALSAALNAKTLKDGDNFTLTGTASINAMQKAGIVMDIRVENANFDEQQFAGGPAIDLTQMDEQAQQTIYDQVKGAVAGIAPQFVLKPGVLMDVTRLLGK